MLELTSSFGKKFKTMKVVSLLLLILPSLGSGIEESTEVLIRPERQQETNGHENHRDEKKKEEPKTVDQLASMAEDFLNSQNRAREEAGLRTREELASISEKWAKVARRLTDWKTGEVMELTRKAQEAQIVSLKFASIATRLNSAVLTAQDVFMSALQRYKLLSRLSRAADAHSSETSRALLFLQYIQSVRENWAMKERARALRLTTSLQNVLNDLKRASEFAHEAHQRAFEASNFEPFFHF